MDIKGTGRVDTARVKRTPKPTSQTDGAFAVPGGDQPRAQSVSGPGPIAALEFHPDTSRR